MNSIKKDNNPEETPSTNEALDDTPSSKSKDRKKQSAFDQLKNFESLPPEEQKEIIEVMKPVIELMRTYAQSTLVGLSERIQETFMSLNKDLTESIVPKWEIPNLISSEDILPIWQDDVFRFKGIFASDTPAPIGYKRLWKDHTNLLETIETDDLLSPTRPTSVINFFVAIDHSKDTVRSEEDLDKYQNVSDIKDSVLHYKIAKEALAAHAAGEIELWLDLQRPKTIEQWNEWEKEHGTPTEIKTRWV